MRARIMGQIFEWYSIIKGYEEGIGFVDEAMDSPFLYWRHRHKIIGINSNKSIIEDVIEFKTILGVIGDNITSKILSNILEYRNIQIKNVLENSNISIDYKDPSKISLKNGFLLCIGMTILGFIIPLINPAVGVISIIVNGIAWFLLWFFTHDLLHLIIGYTLGIKFNNFYIGISNLVNALKIKPSYRLLFIALGIKIDKSIKVSNLRYAIMYISGALASMIFPFYIPIYLVISNGLSIDVILFLSISILNLIIDLIMSSKHGCIRKGIKVLSKD